MLHSVWAIVRDGKIVPLHPIDLPEGSRALVTLVDDAETEHWLAASESSLNAVWDNKEDDRYGELL